MMAMTIPPNWKEHCRQDDRWCQVFISKLMSRGLMLYTLFPKLSKPPPVAPSRVEGCKNDPECLRKLKDEHQDQLRRAALEMAKSEPIQQRGIGVENSGGIESGPWIAVSLILLLILAAIVAYCFCFGQQKTTGGPRVKSGKSNKSKKSSKRSKKRKSLASHRSKKSKKSLSKKRSVRSHKSKKSLKSKRTQRSTRGSQRKSIRQSMARNVRAGSSSKKK